MTPSLFTLSRPSLQGTWPDLIEQKNKPIEGYYTAWLVFMKTWKSGLKPAQSEVIFHHNHEDIFAAATESVKCYHFCLCHCCPKEGCLWPNPCHKELYSYFWPKITPTDLIRGVRSYVYHLFTRKTRKSFLASAWKDMDSDGSFCKCRNRAWKVLVVTKHKVKLQLYTFSPKMMCIYRKEIIQTWLIQFCTLYRTVLTSWKYRFDPAHLHQ